MNSSSRNGAKVIWLAVHTTEGMMRVRDLRDWKAWAGSSHASSDETGALWGPEQGFVPYDQMAWTLRNGNPISDNLEQCGWARWTRAEWLTRPKLLDATARWLAERSKARGIPLVHLSLADIRARKPGVLGHGDYTYATGDGTHTDPGPNYPWDVVIDKARAYAANLQEDDMPTAKEVVDELLARDLYYRFRDDKDPRGYGEGSAKISDLLVDVYTQMFWGHGRNSDWGPGVARQLQALLGKAPVAGGASLDAAKLLADVGVVVRDALGADNAAQADEIVDRLAARLGKPA